MPQGLGRVIGVHEDGDKVFMPAFTQRGRTFTYNIYEVRTNSGSGRQIMRGTSNTKDWIIAPSGDVLARESMDDEKDLYTLDIRDGRGWKTVIEEQVEISTKSLVGLTADGKSVIPGVITHSSLVVEHPELIADRITRFASVVGRENVIAGGDCGFGTQAMATPEVHPSIVWAKFEALAEGARIASERLWG